MTLLKDSTHQVFDAEAIRKGDLVRARYSGWPEPVNGIVTAVSPKELTVLYLPGLGNVSNYFPIPAEEVAAGSWTIQWTSDLIDIQTHGGAE